MKDNNYESCTQGLISVHLKIDIKGFKTKELDSIPIPDIELENLSIDTGVKVSLDTLLESGPEFISYLNNAVKVISEMVDPVKREGVQKHPHPTDSTLKWR